MTRLSRPRVASLVGVLAGNLICIGAFAQSGETGNVCAQDYQSGAVCTANDVRIEKLDPVTVVEDCNTGTVGEAEIVFEMLISADGSPDRFDIGVFLALDGGSARTGDSCFHDYLEPPLTATPTFGDANSDMIDDIKNGPWSNLETDDPSDTCGDIDGGTQVIKTLQQLTVQCVDSNFDGSVDVSVCASWDNNSRGTCTGVTEAFPGTNSKCGCTALELGIPPPSAAAEPDITVSKNPPDQTIPAGSDAEFTILVHNSGDTNLANIGLNDAYCDQQSGPSGDDANNILDVGETWAYTCTTESVVADFTNTVTVTADPTDESDGVSDSATADVVVIAPSISVDKNPPTQTVPEGGKVGFEILVHNTGDVDLTNVQVIDPTCDSLTGPFGDDGDGLLGIGETWAYDCTVDVAEMDFTNVVNVTATPPAGDDVSNAATADVSVVPASSIPTLSIPSKVTLVVLLAAAGLGVLLMVRSRFSS